MTTQSTNRPIGIGIIGMGYMGQTHARAYLDAIADGSDARLVAVCDPDPDLRSGLASNRGNIGPGDAPDRIFDADDVAGYDIAGALLADDAIDLVSVCTPTDTHVDLATLALQAGKHVLVEKPVAIRGEEIERLIGVAERSGRLCIPAMCMRHWPGWRELKSIIDAGTHGRVVHARFERLGSMPAWGTAFYADLDRSGGAIFDLHVHDADMALWLFGATDAVSSVGDHHHIDSQYRYKQGPAVTTTGGWLNDPSCPFSMRYTVEFERAVLTFDSNAEHPATLHANGQATHPTLEPGTGYDHQARAVIDAAGRSQPEGLPTLGDALAVTRLIDAERRSASEARPIPSNI